MRSRRAAREFSVVDGYAALVEKERMEPVPEADLLAEERRMAGSGRWWRPWWLTAGFSGEWLSGQRGTIMALAAVGALAGWLVWMMATGGGRTGLGGDISGWDGDIDYSVSPEAGRFLRAGEVELGLAYGEPVELGLGGQPVVVHAGTGEERELTAMEVDFFEEHGGEGLDGVGMGVNRVLWNPGPQGWGMWWREMPVDRATDPELGFTRSGWLVKQESELQWLVWRFQDASLVLDRLDDPLVRHRGLGAELAAVLDRIVGRYPIVGEERGVMPWAGVPTRWVCVEDLEFAANGGITQGCPTVSYVGAVSEVWGSAGAVFREMSEIARLLNYMDGLATGDYYQSGLVPDLYFGLVDLVEVEVVNLGRAVGNLRRVSLDEGMFFSVDLFGDGGG